MSVEAIDARVEAPCDIIRRSSSIRKSLKEKEIDHCQREDTSRLRAFSQSFYTPELADLRKEYWTIVLRAVALTLLLMWACLPVYWGALAYSARMTSNLTAWFIDRDNSRLGHALWSDINNTSSPGPQLGWVFVDGDSAGSDQDIIDAVIGEQVWLALVVEANATHKLATARQNGDSSYDPASAITVYYSQARQEIATGNYVVPLSTALLEKTTSAWATTSAQQYLAQIYAQGEVNGTALELLARAPQTISPAVGWTTVNLRPYNAPVATAVTLVGQIFLCIFAFITAMANAAARALIQRHLRFSHYLILRFAVPLVAYVPMSLTYTLVSLAFHLPFDTRYNTASGFMLFWLYVYLGMAALGLALESMITVLTPKFVPFFLFSLIIANVASAVLPDELQPAFYSFSIAFPVWNLSQAMRTIVFNTYSYLPRNAAVLVGWILLSSLTLVAFTWYIRRCEMIAALQGEVGSKMEKLERKVGETEGPGA